MSLRFFTGFDYYNVDQLNRIWNYSSGGQIIMPGRFGGQAFGWNNAPGYLSQLVPNTSTNIIGLAFTMAYGDATNPFIILQDATASRITPITQVDFRVTSDAGFQVTRNGTVIATSLPNLFEFNFWNYLEIETFISNSAGYVILRLNGAVYMNVASLDTQYTGNNYINMVRFQAFDSTGEFNIAIDDLYICDDAGDVNNDFLGECRVQTQWPTANGEQHTFTPVGASSNYQCVDEIIADDDTTYVSSAEVGNIDDYQMGTISLSGTIYGLQLNVTERKDDVGVRSVAPVIYSYSHYNVGTTTNCQSQYVVAQNIWEIEPTDAEPWTNTSVNQITAGIKIVG